MAKDLKPLDEGDTVRMTPYRLGDKKWPKGVICDKLDERLYRVDTGDGTYCRNCIHVHKTQRISCPLMMNCMILL